MKNTNFNQKNGNSVSFKTWITQIVSTFEQSLAALRVNIFFLQLQISLVFSFLQLSHLGFIPFLSSYGMDVQLLKLYSNHHLVMVKPASL